MLTPPTRPRESTSGPPELPGFSAASVWITSSINRPLVERKERPRALTTPAEGQEIQVSYRGSVVDILKRIRGHVRSAVSYTGCTSLAEAREVISSDPAAWLIPLSEAS